MLSGNHTRQLYLHEGLKFAAAWVVGRFHIRARSQIRYSIRGSTPLEDPLWRFKTSKDNKAKSVYKKKTKKRI